jgi:archaellum biogenesis ATPase FlaH
MIRAEAQGYKYKPAKQSREEIEKVVPKECRHAFTVETGNRWMDLGSREPAAKMLFGEFWYQGELCILFADTNVGKSILATQIGNSIALGKRIAPFALHAKPTKVLYIDFELSAKQFYRRYRNTTEGSYNFNDNFFRAQFNSEHEMPDTYTNYDKYILAGMEYKIRQVNATVLIIDNITCLRGGTENTSVALNLMKNLKRLKTELGLSILVLAHTPKRRNPGAPISTDDLHGSKLLINFADSAFAIGASSTQQGLCYLKQIKQRNTSQVYGEDNVCLCRIHKPGNFLQFRFMGNSPETLHLRTRHQLNPELLAQKAAQLSATGLSQRQISRELNVSLGYVNKLLK